MGSHKWRGQAGSLQQRDIPIDVQEKVAQGAGDHLSRDGRFVDAAGPFGDWSVRCIVKTRKALREEESGEQALSSSALLHGDDG